MASNRAGSAWAASTSARSRSRWTRRGPSSSGRSTFQNAGRATVLHRLRDGLVPDEADVGDLADEELAVADEQGAGGRVDAGRADRLGRVRLFETDQASGRDLSF